MNIISFEKAYSLYPWTTFEERRSLINVPVSPHYDQAFEKYSARGWKMIRDPSPTTSIPREFRIKSRWIDDRYTWVIPLDLEGVQLSPPLNPHSLQRRPDPVSITNWQMRIDPRSSPTHIHHCVIETDTLAWAYLLGDEISAFYVKSQFVKRVAEKAKMAKAVGGPKQ
jgi:hypothetical protein